MQPRWDYGWNYVLASSLERYKFIGGTPDFDIWFRGKGREETAYIALVNGHSDDDWAAYPYVEGVLKDYGEADENDSASLDLRNLVVQKHEEVETYLKLFAPWAVEESHA